jgi:RNA polymerase sigma-70 factor (ECF subfamily)
LTNSPRNRAIPAKPAAQQDAELLYDRRWALTLIERVMLRLREEFAVAGKIDLYEAIKGTLTGDAPPYAEIATTLQTSEGAVKVAVHRLRERYRETIRAEIAETVGSESEVEEELRHLLAVLSR